MKEKQVPVLNFMEKTKDGRFLKNYSLNYTNRAGNEKIYEMVSNYNLSSPEEIGARASGVIILGYKDDCILLCKEFRMGLNDFIYNLPAGHIDQGEDVLECAKRELYEETGLVMEEVIDVLNPSYAAPDLSDSSAWIVVARVAGEFADHTEENEWIDPGFFCRDEVARLLKEEKFSGRAQLFAWFFSRHIF